MTTDMYELVSLAARYVFVLLMLLIVTRAARNTFIDNRRAAKLRKLSPMTGMSGELLVTEGRGSVRPGMTYTLIREGVIGSARRSDICVRCSSVRRRHVIFRLEEDGLHLRGHANLRIYDEHGHARSELVLHDGDVFRMGGITLMLVLSMPEGENISGHPKRKRGQIPETGTDENGYDPFEVDEDTQFEENAFGLSPRSAERPARRRESDNVNRNAFGYEKRPRSADELFDVDDDDDDF